MKKQFLALVVSLLLGHNLDAKLIDGVKAVVNNNPILISDVSKRMSDLKSSATLSNILGYGEDKINEGSVLEHLIKEKIILDRAEAINSTPSESDVNSQIAAIAKQNGLSVSALKSSLKKEKISFETYKEAMRVQIARRAIVEKELRSSTSGTTDQELRRAFNENVGKEVNLVLVQFGTSKSAVSSLEALETKINQSPQEASKLLTKHSPIELGWTSAGELNPNFSQALLKNKSSAVGPVKWDGKNYLLVRLGTRDAPEDKFLKVKEQIRQQLQAQEINERFEAWLSEQRKKLNIVVNPS